MTALLSLAIATGMVAATPIEPASWLTNEDYPSTSKLLVDGGTIHTSIMVSPKGNPIRCVVKYATDSSKMGAILCKALMSKAGFEPARDQRGEPTYMAYSFGIAFPRAITSDTAFKSSPLQVVTPVDIAVDVAHLPEGMTRKVIGIVAQTDTGGNITACMPFTPDPASAKFEAVACSQAKALAADPALDENGKPVTALRNWTVVFRTATK